MVLTGLSLTKLELYCRNKKIKIIWADKFWIYESIKIVFIEVKGSNDPVKKKKFLQAIQVDVPWKRNRFAS